MPSPITAIAPAAVQAIQAPSAGSKAASAFESILTEAVNRVENFQAGANKAVEQFLSGEDEEIHKVALATQQAQVSFELFLQAKNKVVQAYQEVMRMQL